MAAEDPPAAGAGGRPTRRSLAAHWRAFAAAVGDDVRGFDWESERTGRALATGLATAAAVLAAMALDLDYPMWSGISAFLVVQASARATALKSVLRIAGTLGAALVSVLVLGFVADSHIGLVLALFAGVSYPLYRSYRSAYPYAWQLGAITTGIILVAALADPAIGLRYAAYRAAEIGTGTLAAYAVARLALPGSLGPEVDLALAKPTETSAPLAERAALEAGLGVVLVTLVYDWLDLPGFSSATVSMTRLVDPNPDLGRHRGLLRLIGAAVGGAAGLVAAGLSIDALPGLALGVFSASAVFAYFFAGAPASSYAGMQGGMAFLIAFAPGLAPVTTLEPAIDRLAGIIVAMLVFWLIDAMITPPDRPPPAGPEATPRSGAAR